MRWLPAVVVAAVLIASCSGSSEDRLVGKWEIERGGETLEFLDDGTVLTGDGRGPTFGGTWQLGDDTHLRVSFGGPAAYAPPKDYVVAVSDDALRATDESGKTRTYHRMD